MNKLSLKAANLINSRLVLHTEGGRMELQILDPDPKLRGVGFYELFYCLRDLTDYCESPSFQ